MAPDRRRQAIFGVLVLVLVLALAALLVFRPWRSPTAAAGGASSRRVARVASTPGPAPVPDVRLDALDAERPRPESRERNPFRFKPSAPPPPPAVPPGVIRPGVDAAPPPSGPPPPPPIGLKFIGIVEALGQAQKIAVLSDGRNVFHGREGDIIEGRYRILRIGAESLEIAYADGRGRQTIRLTGG
jgi:hypothetical protein